MFGLAEATPGHTLSLLAFHLFTQAGHVKKFSLNEAKLCCYLRKVEQGYNASNPYHNRSDLQLWTVLPPALQQGEPVCYRL